ncbi:DUF711 family protein [Candidatus Poribacteria bacterium]
MKIRTITTGISLQSPREYIKITQAAESNRRMQSFFEQQGYEVQETRITTNSWETYLQGLSTAEIVDEVQRVEQTCQDLGVDCFNIGYASTPEKIAIIPEFNKITEIIYCSSKIGDFESGIDFENAKASAEAIKRISQETENGYGNFRFCAWANCEPGIPFFPTGYHEGETAFAIGLECSDLLMKAFSKSSDLVEAEQNLSSIFGEELQKIETFAQQISDELQLKYGGIDSSLAPSLEADESIAFAYEKLGFGKFGSQGTLTISAIITRVLKSLPVKTCGYSGLMLPVCEDFGLAERANERTYGLTNLLLYSAVCGCGLDTVPIPGDVTAKDIEAILLDMATLAIRLNKPLSARLFPVPGKKAGEMTSFNSPFLVDCRILAI